MERPDLSKLDEDVVKYIESLEKKLELFTSGSTISLFYVGLKKQVDDISALFITWEMTERDLKDKDDKIVDRYFKYLEKSKIIAENLMYVEKLVTPEHIEEAKLRADAIAEKYIFNQSEEGEEAG